MKIIVLSITPYKEKDGIINAISEQGDITFSAKGILDPKNKNSAISNVLTIADIELQEGNYRYPVLKAVSNVENPMKLDNDLDYLSCLLLVAEATKQLLQDDEKERIFNSLIGTIRTIKKARKPWANTLVYIAQLLKIGGYEFEVNRCVFCGSKKNIVLFSFSDGGFVCQDCLEPDMARDLTRDQMFLIRSAFNAKDIDTIDFNCEKEDALVVLNKFFEFISESFGTTLKSASLIK